MAKTVFSWEVEQERVTLFLFPGLEVNSDAVWKAITDTAPDEVTNRPALRTTTMVGDFESGKLTLNATSQRVDIIYSPNPNFHEVNPSKGFAVLGARGALGKTFVDAVSKCFPDCPKATRLAYGATMLKILPSKKESYEALASLLPSVKLDTENSSEFQYSINRPRMSKISPELKINRISKWNGLKVSLASFNFSGQANVQISAPDFIEHAARLEVDISTDEEKTDEILSVNIVNFLNEMYEMAEEICISGDVK